MTACVRVSMCLYPCERVREHVRECVHERVRVFVYFCDLNAYGNII